VPESKSAPARDYAADLPERLGIRYQFWQDSRRPVSVTLAEFLMDVPRANFWFNGRAQQPAQYKP